MRRPLLALFLLGGVYACGAPAPKVMKAAPETEIVLVYNSDDKGDYRECGCKPAHLGGLVRRATVIRNERANHANVLAVHGGGWSVPGTLESQRLQSDFHLEVMGKLAYSALNVTPADLSYGVEALRQAAAANNLRLVSSNLKYKSKDAWVFDPYTIVDVNGVRVAFLGVMEEGEPLSPLTKEGDDLMTLDAEDALRALLPEVRAKADLVVLFAHLTQRGAETLLDEVHGIDVAISGKDDFVNYKATEVGNDSTGKALLLQAGERGKYVGALTMVVSEHGKILRYDHQVTALDKNIKDDSLVVLQVAGLEERLKDVRKREAVEQIVGPSASAPSPEK